ncbi:acyltransferase family protein [Dysgonomonas sp. Marseille-P4361]|uniref:acyltransferase family protein n=1 Tax=Dysgonomonas sp. Marseille-P4361 TaxID=2161820 RepID=UPI000D54C9DB|nr:acyltransferase family protein [Dysgonomonas sp. Marseille-P4361]
MNISLYSLSKQQTTILKGLAIIMIVLHNIIHKTNHISENEFDFDPERILRLFVSFKHSLWFLINGTLTLWGFFGIQLFIFISGFGLVKQFMNKKPTSYWKYLLPKVIKIYSLILIGLVFYALLLFPIGETTLLNYIHTIKSYLLLSKNFSTHTLFITPHAGPWWYFSFIIQLYIIFPVLYYFLNKYKEKGFMGMLIISYILIYTLTPIAKQHDFPIYANFIGHLPDFIIGMVIAFFKEFRINYKVIIPTLIIFILSNFYEFAFPLSFASATILLLVIFYPFYKETKTITAPHKALLFIGQISMFMFVINGPLRPYFDDYIYGVSQFRILLVALIHLGLTILLSYITSIIYEKFLTKPLNKLIKFVSS